MKSLQKLHRALYYFNQKIYDNAYNKSTSPHSATIAKPKEKQFCTMSTMSTP